MSRSSRRADKHSRLSAGLGLSTMLLAGLALHVPTSFGSVRSHAAAGTPSGTLTIATDEPPQTFDPLQALNSTVDQMNLNDYNTLVQYPAGTTATLQPQLATSWTISPSGLDYTFDLRSGVTFHDGSLLTAGDVAFTFNRVAKLGVGVAGELGPFSRAKVLSPTKVELVLSKRYSPFLDALSRIYVLEKSLVSQHLGSDMGQTWLSTHDAGTGPYMLQAYTTGTQAIFTDYPKYWGGWSGHHVAKVVYNFITSASAQQEALLSGQANIAMNIARSSLSTFKSKPGYSVNVSKTLEEFYVFLNTQYGPTKSMLVREALAHAYDYKTHVASILGGYGVVASGPIPDSMACHANIPTPSFNLSLAKALFQKAGYAGTTLTMNYEPETFEQADSFLLLQSDLAKIGITVKAVPSTFPQTVTMLKSVKTTPNLIALYAFPVDPNPNEVLYQTFYSGFADGKGYNASQYADPAYDKLVLAAQQTTSQAQQCALYEQAQKMLADQYVTINVSNPDYVTVLGPGVHGYQYYVMHTQTEDTYDISVG